MKIHFFNPVAFFLYKAKGLSAPPPLVQKARGSLQAQLIAGVLQGAASSSFRNATSEPTNSNYLGPNPSSRTMALGSTQPLTEMSTRNVPGGKERSAGA
jgi:hypothetical protein